MIKEIYYKKKVLILKKGFPANILKESPVSRLKTMNSINKNSYIFLAGHKGW